LASRYVFEGLIAFDRHINKRFRFWYGTMREAFRLDNLAEEEKYSYYGSYVFDAYSM